MVVNYTLRPFSTFFLSTFIPIFSVATDLFTTPFLVIDEGKTFCLPDFFNETKFSSTFFLPSLISGKFFPFTFFVPIFLMASLVVDGSKATCLLDFFNDDAGKFSSKFFLASLVPGKFFPLIFLSSFLPEILSGIFFPKGSVGLAD